VAIGPGLPLAMAVPSICTTGVTKALAEVTKASSAPCASAID